MSIRLRLTIWYSSMLTIALLLFGITIYFSVSQKMYDDVKNDLRNKSWEIYTQIRGYMVQTDEGIQYTITLPPHDIYRFSGIYVQAVDSEGRITDKSTETLGRYKLPIPDLKQTKKENKAITKKVKVAGRSLLVYNYPLIGNGQFFGVLQVASSVDSIDKSLSSIKRILALIGLLAIVLAATLGMFLARKALRPIESVIDAASQIENGVDLGRRIEYNGPPDEIGRLSKTINGMLSRLQTVYTELEDAYRAQRRFVSDASHELRTPLTTIRGNVELMAKMWSPQSEGHPSAALAEGEKMKLTQEALTDITDESKRMSRLVNDMLSLARADAGYQMDKEPVELGPLIEDVARRAQFLPRTADWQLGDLDELEGIYVLGHRDYLQQLLFIFIENAFKYTEEGVVRLDVCRTAGQVGLQISDTGIGLDKEEVPHIFERFYRADPSRGKTAGTGLGLSIAKWIIDELSGSIEVKTRKNEGTTFIIWFPIRFQEQV